MKLAIVGSRTYPDLAEVREYVEHLPADTVIVSGTEPNPKLGDDQQDVDRMAIWTARKRGLETIVFPPDYKQYGRFRAPIIRNGLIAKECEEMTAFWDGISNGTANVIDKARKLRRPLTIRYPRQRPSTREELSPGRSA